MPALIRLDQTGHTTLAEWSQTDDDAFEQAVRAFERELDSGYFAVVSADGPDGHEARMVHELPREAELVIMRRRIAGGR